MSTEIAADHRTHKWANQLAEVESSKFPIHERTAHSGRAASRQRRRGGLENYLSIVAADTWNASGDRSLTAKHKLSVAEWNCQPVTTTAGRELLEAVGFVRDYQEMTLYGGWR